MRKAERAQIVLDTLEAHYPETPVPLDHKDHFTLLVAVLLSAQCTDERVNKVTPKLFALADNPRDMCKVSPDTIYKIIRPCGLGPKKSKAIYDLSHILCSSYGGQVPADIKALEKLPGVGHKTASVVISQGFGQPAFPVDTHIHRLAQRWGLTKGKNVTATEKDLKKFFLKPYGISFIFKLFFGAESSARLSSVTVSNVKFVGQLFQKDRNLFPTRSLR